jgi:adenylate kinase
LEAEDEENGVVLTEEDHRRRKPHPAFKHYLATERTVARLRKKDSLHTIVVTAGLVYGQGEWLLHGWFKEAWTLRSPTLDVYGKGTNAVPMVHVADLAGTVEALARAGAATPSRNVIVVDEAQSTLGEIVSAINSEVGYGAPLNYLKAEEVLLLKDVELLLVNTRLEASTARQTDYEWKFPEGFVGRIGDVATEFRNTRGLLPVKIVVNGPPTSGKTHLCAELARMYHIHHVSAADVISEYLAAADEGERDDIAAQREENGGRIPDEALVRMFRRKLFSKPCANQGYVLDGFPKTAEQAALLWPREDEGTPASAPGDYPDEVPPPQKLPNIEPEFAVLLEASDEFLADRAMEMLTTGKAGSAARLLDEATFRRRLGAYRLANTDTSSPFVLLEERGTDPLVLQAAPENQGPGGLLAAVALRVGRPRNYGPSVNEVALLARQDQRQAEEQHEARRAEQERVEIEEKERRRRRDEKERERLAAIHQQERDNLDVHALPLRKYLLENVMPTVTEALIEICKVRPEDPLDYLAEYLFRASPDEEA